MEYFLRPVCGEKARAGAQALLHIHRSRQNATKRQSLEECIMLAMVPGLKGYAEYARPDWCVHPDDRPKKKARE
ncbi:hypothetical protein [Mesorhizobium sp. BHbdii]